MAAIDDSARALRPEDSLREHFSAWERLGRGWSNWEYPVQLEPPFTPYFGYDISPVPSIDDGRKHTILSGFIQWIQEVGQKRPEKQDGVDSDPLLPEVWSQHDRLVELQLSIPQTTEVTKDAAEHFLLSIGSSPTAFEIIAASDRITCQIACAASQADNVSQQFQSYFPTAIIFDSAETLDDKWHDARGGDAVIAEFGLAREFMLPLASPRSFGVDPLTGIIGAMSNVMHSELAVTQILFQPVSCPWAESILRSVSFPDGTPLFYGARDLLKQAIVKVSRPLYAAVVRIATKGSEERAWALAQALAGGFSPFSNPEGNELIPLQNDSDDLDAHVRNLLDRSSRRCGMLLNSDELVAFVHPPSASIYNPKLRQHKATRAAPAIVLHEGLALGRNDHVGAATTPKLTADQRTRHMHVLGGSGTGKSTFLLHQIIQTMESGDGVALFDPHGDLVDSVLEHIPPGRIDDVVLFDPGDEEYPVGFNILSAHSDVEKNLLASDLVSVFRRLSTSWGDQMNAILANTILAFLESSRGGTLLDVRRFLVEASFRKEFLESVQDPEIIYYWTKEYPLVAGRSSGSILTRLNTFLRPKSIRRMVGQKNNRLDFNQVMDTGKIFLARLSHGAIGEENAYLLGTLLVSKFHQLALSRQKQKEAERKFFWLYIDEVHNFATPSMAAILSGARKYRLGLVVAHQELHQIEQAAPEVASALGNAYTRVCFRLGDKDAKQLESGFAGFAAADLQNLGTGEAICRVERPEYSFNISTVKPMSIDPTVVQKLKGMVIDTSRKKYATPLAEVEAELAKAIVSDAPSFESKRVMEKKRVDPGEPPSAMVPLSAVSAEPAYVVVPVSEPLKRAARSSPVEPPSLGRGGAEHKYLQHLIKRFAEGLGFRADIEGEAMHGAADVALRKGKTSIACEITITTENAHELANIRKCLAAGFTHVIAVSPDAKRLGKLQMAMEGEPNETERQKVRCLAPDDLLAFIREVAAKELNDEKTVRGYRVKTNYRAVDDAEGADKRERISGVIAGALKRVTSRKR